MTESYKHLVNNLKSYVRIRSFYQFFRGILLVSALVFSYVIAISLVEFHSYLSVDIRTFLFFLTCFLVLILIGIYVIFPAFRLLGILKPISYEKAAKLIAEHFPEMEDRLLNVIELAQIGEETDEPLVWASIDEKIERLKVFNFSQAIPVKRLLRPLSFLFGVVVLAGILTLVFPGIFKESSRRLIHYDKQFSRPAPFTFHLINESLSVKKGDPLLLEVECSGRQIPEVLYVNIGGSNYLMSQENGVFTYPFEHINNSFSLRFTDLQFFSENYKIKVLPAPIITDYSVEIVPPAYTGLERSKEEMLGDIEVAYGSEIRWIFKTADTDSLYFTADGNRLDAVHDGGQFVLEYRAEKDLKYTVSVSNESFHYSDLLSFNLSVIPDLYPEIQVVQLRDSIDYTRYYFKGRIADDYGFHSLNYELIINQKDSLVALPVVKNLNQQDFYFTFDFKALVGKADVVDYHFAVRDNDYFHSYKEAISESFQFRFPTKEELALADDQNFEGLEQLMEESFQLSQDIQQSIDELRFKSLSENSSDWEKKQLVNEVLNKRNRLEEILEQVQQKNAEMNNLKNSFSEEQAEIVEKQKQIEDLLEDVFNDELKALFEEFKKLAQDFDQSKLNELSDRSKMSMDDLSKQLERNLQMLKRMKVEQEMTDVIQQLQKLGEKEKSNLDQLQEGRNFSEAQEREKSNQEEFEKTVEDLNKALELNRSLEKPLELDPMEKEQIDIKSNYDNIQESIEQRRKRKSLQQMEENTRALENMAFSLGQMLEMNQQKQRMENIDNLKQILDNLVYISLTQEGLHDEIRQIDDGDPRLSSVRVEQDKLIKQSEVVKDSLYALANRTPEIGNVVTKELLTLELAMNKAVGELEESRMNTALREQQMAITAANNMALFLSEALDNLQKQMAEGMPGDQQCDKPGGNQSQMNMLKDAQQNLKQQLQQMIEQMKQGQSGNMSEQIGQTLAQQEMMQQMIRELMMDSEVGSAAKEQLKQINELLEHNNIDLANKNINSTLISRQNLILNKLLKAEKAEMERDVEDERESKTVDDSFYSNPIEFFEYKKQEKEFNDAIERNNYQLRNFYDRKYKNYINNLREEN